MSGRVLARTKVHTGETKMVSYDADGNEVTEARSSIYSQLVNTRGSGLESISLATVDYICMRLGEGRLLMDILKEDGMPSPSRLKWMRDNYPRIDKMIRSGLEAQAQRLVEETLSSMDSVTDKDEAAVFKVKADMVKWVAQSN